jgi:hypothetical protein
MKLSECPYFLAICGCGQPVSQDRIDRIRQLKKENPEANYKQLAIMAFDSVYVVEKALRNEIQ